MELELFFRDHWSELNAIYPVYQNGNNTELLLTGGRTSLIEKRIKTVKKCCCRAFGVDPEARARQYRAIAGKKNAVPLVLRANLVLVPVKTRVPVGDDDGAWGYVVLAKVAGLSPAGKVSEVVFKDNSRLQTLVSAETLRISFSLAEVVHRLYCQEEGVFPAGQVKEVTNGYLLVSLDGKENF